MFSHRLLIIGALVAVAAAVPGQGGPGAAWGGPAAGGWGAGSNPWMPSWLASAPWLSPRISCNEIGSTCLDCSTRLVCTKVGGIQRACTDPSLPFCNLGQCSAKPTVGCKAA